MKASRRTKQVKLNNGCIASLPHPSGAVNADTVHPRPRAETQESDHRSTPGPRYTGRYVTLSDLLLLRELVYE